MEILALDYLKEKLPSIPIELTSDAWLSVGVKRASKADRQVRLAFLCMYS